MHQESSSNHHPDKVIRPRPIMEVWKDDQIIDAILSNKLQIESLPGLERSGIGWVACPVTVGGVRASETYQMELQYNIAVNEDSIEENKWGLIDALQNRRFSQATAHSDQCSYDSIDEVEGDFDPRRFSCVFGLDISDLNVYEALHTLLIIKTLERTGIGFGMVAFMDTIVDVQGQPVYVQRQFDLKCDSLPPQKEFWEELMSLCQLRLSDISSFASWAPAHVMAMANLMDNQGRQAPDAEYYLNYMGALELPFQPIISREADYRQRADIHIDNTLDNLKGRHPGHWHLDIHIGEEFGTVPEPTH